MEKKKLNQDDLFLLSLGICATEFVYYIFPMIMKTLKPQDFSVLSRLIGTKDIINPYIDELLNARIFNHFEFLDTDRGVQVFLNINGEKYPVRYSNLKKPNIFYLYPQESYNKVACTKESTPSFYKKMKTIQDFYKGFNRDYTFDYFDKASWYFKSNKHDYDSSLESWSNKAGKALTVASAAKDMLTDKKIDLTLYDAGEDFLDNIIANPELFEFDYQNYEGNIPVITEKSNDFQKTISCSKIRTS